MFALASPVEAATIVTFVAVDATGALTVTNPQPVAVTGRIRLIPDAGFNSPVALPFSLATNETKSFPNVLAIFGASSASAILAIESTDVVRMSSAPLRIAFTERHLTLPVRFNPATPTIGSLVLGVLNGSVRVNIYDHQGSSSPVASRTLASDSEETFRLRYADMLGAFAVSDGFVELIPLSGQAVGTVVNPPMRRRAAAPPSTPPPTLSITGTPACEFSAGVRASVLPASGATYRWSLLNATAQGSAAGDTLDMVLGSRGYAAIALERSIGGSLSTAEAIIAIDGKPAYIESSASSVTLGQDSTITWALTGSAPTSQTLSGTDFGTVALDPTATSYTYHPTTSGEKTYALTADNACGSGSARGDYAVSAACTTPRIDSFTNSGPICAGGSAQLTWATSGSGTVTLDHGIGSMPASGSLAVGPTATTTYTLTKTAACGTVVATTTTTVTTPNATSFTIDRNPVPFGCYSTLRFTIANAASWTLTSPLHNGITPNSGTGSGSFTAIYSLDEAVGDDAVALSVLDSCGNTATQTLTVSGTDKQPVITNFSAPASVASGASGTLSFTYTDGTNWVLTSSLGNTITPSAGTSTTGGTATYTRDKASGPDTITLAVTDQCNGVGQKRVIN